MLPSTSLYYAPLPSLYYPPLPSLGPSWGWKQESPWAWDYPYPHYPPLPSLGPSWGWKQGSPWAWDLPYPHYPPLPSLGPSWGWKQGSPWAWDLPYPHYPPLPSLGPSWGWKQGSPWAWDLPYPHYPPLPSLGPSWGWKQDLPGPGTSLTHTTPLYLPWALLGLKQALPPLGLPLPTPLLPVPPSSPVPVPPSSPGPLLQSLLFSWSTAPVSILFFSWSTAPVSILFFSWSTAPVSILFFSGSTARSILSLLVHCSRLHPLLLLVHCSRLHPPLLWIHCCCLLSILPTSPSILQLRPHFIPQHKAVGGLTPLPVQLDSTAQRHQELLFLHYIRLENYISPDYKFETSGPLISPLHSIGKLHQPRLQIWILQQSTQSINYHTLSHSVCYSIYAGDDETWLWIHKVGIISSKNITWILTYFNKNPI
uniref:Uncharacterized protein n=1 Tax=Branchiostoma floridae TaxID=7739 RepID=C3ZVT8_BRAFL|eukprot:XP_002587342.1 hypothetical protein BRAFLDRAFT_100540 [Branchiostoma floridae]